MHTAAAWQSVSIDEYGYKVCFQGYHQPLMIALEDETHLELQPWSMGDNLNSIGRHIMLDGALPAISTSNYATEVLNKSEIPEEYHLKLLPLALWWAAGGIEPLPAIQLDGNCYKVGQYVFVLRAWSAGERMKCLSGSIQRQPAGERYDFDHLLYLQGLLETCIVSTDPEIELMQIDTATMLTVLDQIFSLNQQHTNSPDDQNDTTAELLELSPHFSRKLLQLSSVLDCPLEKLLALPAKQLDQFLTLIDNTNNDTRAGNNSTIKNGSRIGHGAHDVLIKISED